MLQIARDQDYNAPGVSDGSDGERKGEAAVAEPLAAELLDAWERARDAWPGIAVDKARFAAHVMTRLPEPATADALAALDVIDLYFACACIADAPNARDLFARTLLVQIAPHLRRLDPSPAFADEVRQRLAEKLVVEAGGARLADYRGRGPLAAWLRVAAIRCGLDVLARDQPQRARTLDDAIADLPVDDDLELAYLRERYVPAYREAIRAALAALSSQQRNVLRLHLVSRVTTQRIGTLFQVNQSTVVRWLAAARADIRAHAETALVAALHVSPSEIASLTRLVLSRLDLSIAGLLGDEPPA
jgi:RNA polymerase sigma-70 factor (ECF subfamily)